MNCFLEFQSSQQRWTNDRRRRETFHLTSPKTIGLRGIYRGVAAAAGLPPLRGSLPRSVAAPVLNVRGRPKLWRNMVATQLGIPGEIFDVVDLAPTFVSEQTQDALSGTGITVPEFGSYAPALWRYWAAHLDPDRARRDDPAVGGQPNRSAARLRTGHGGQLLRRGADGAGLTAALA